MPVIPYHKIKKMAVDDVLTKIKYGYIYKNGVWQKVWSGASEVTVILGGAVIDTLEVDDEDEILAHLSTPTVPEGATFIGWSNDLNNSNPMTEYFADGDPKIVYAIYKYDDQVLANNVRLDWGNNGYSYQNSRKSVCSVDGNKFKSVKVYAHGGCDVAGWAYANTINGYVGINGGVEEWMFTESQVGGITTDGDHRYKQWRAQIIDKTWDVPQISTYVYGRAEGDCYEAHMNVSVTGLGRTYVG